MMDQDLFIYQYNEYYRPKFNPALFDRNDDGLINGLMNIIKSSQRETTNFKIQVTGLDVIESYDDINHILWAYEDSAINKNKNKGNLERVMSTEEEKQENSEVDEKEKAKVKKQNAKSGRINQFEYINLKDSAIKLLRIRYHIEIIEKKNGLVKDDITAYIAIPRIVDKFYYRINGKHYFAMFQVSDASTYNNTASSKKNKKQTITLKTKFGPILTYRFQCMLSDINDNKILCTAFYTNAFTKTVLSIKYMLAKMGFYGTLNFLKIKGLMITENTVGIDDSRYYIFPIREGINVVIDKFIYDNNQIAQSFVFTIHEVIKVFKQYEYKDIFGREIWYTSLGNDFIKKGDIEIITNKGIALTSSIEGNYDIGTREDIRLALEDKDTVYNIIRWIMYEFNTLKKKDNVDITTKKVSCDDYVSTLYGTRLITGINRLSDKGDRADINTMKGALLIQPMFLLNAISNCPLVTYKDCVNDLDSISALKYTFKGVSGIGEKSNAIPANYRTVHYSHLGKIDIDSSSNSDPGVSGTLCPLYTGYSGKNFSEFQEPSSWLPTVNELNNQYCTNDPNSFARYTNTQFQPIPLNSQVGHFDIVGNYIGEPIYLNNHIFYSEED